MKLTIEIPDSIIAQHFSGLAELNHYSTREVDAKDPKAVEAVISKMLVETIQDYFKNHRDYFEERKRVLPDKKDIVEGVVLVAAEAVTK